MNSVTQVLFSLAVVIPLIILTAYLLKRQMLKPIKGITGITVVKQIALGTKERILLVDVEGVKLVLGISNNAFNTLYVFDKKPSEDGLARESSCV